MKNYIPIIFFVLTACGADTVPTLDNLPNMKRVHWPWNGRVDYCRDAVFTQCGWMLGNCLSRLTYTCQLGVVITENIPSGGMHGDIPSVIEVESEDQGN